MIQLIHGGFATVTSDFCMKAKVVEHYKEIMDAAMDAENLIDVEVRPFIIDLVEDQVSIHFNVIDFEDV